MSKIINVNSITEIHQIFGAPAPKHPLVTLIDFSNPAFSQPSIELNAKYVLNFYCISLKDFKGIMKYGRFSYDFAEGTMVFMAPGQIITFDEAPDPDVKDILGLFFHPDLIRHSALADKIDAYSFFNYETNEALHMSADEKATITDCFYKIQKEFTLNIDKHSQALIVSNLELLLNYCTRFYDRQFLTRTSSNKDIIIEFEKYLKQYFLTDKPSTEGVPSVKKCAEAMNLSPNYLSDLLKKETGKNTIEHIHFHVIKVAKNKLLNTSLPINEIAYDLGFEYPAYFTKVFKSKTGMSPSAYRKMN